MRDIYHSMFVADPFTPSIGVGDKVSWFDNRRRFGHVRRVTSKGFEVSDGSGVAFILAAAITKECG